MVIIVTGTIAPDAKVGQLQIRSSEERLSQYKKALYELISSGAHARVVFCDNSSFGTDGFTELTELAKDRGVEFEVLSFCGDADAVIKHGKGYGEGEILDYALDNSKLAEGESFFIKVTGRLVVDNIADIVDHLVTDRIYFNIPNIHRRDMYDTRLYAMPVGVYRDVFSKSAKRVDDSAGYYLEHAFTDAAFDGGMKVYNFPRYPRIRGVSGSGGIRYEYTEWKSRIRDFLSIFNFYSKIRKDKG